MSEKSLTKQIDSVLRAAKTPKGLAVTATGFVGLYALLKLTKFKKKTLDDDSPRFSKKKRGGVDALFFDRLLRLLKIVLPGVRSKEFLILAIHTGFLVTRTYLSILVARMDGIIIRSIVERRPRKFFLDIGKWLLLAVPATYVNSMIRFLESKLAIAFRTRLSEHLYRKYLERETYYRVGNLDSRLSNPDQCLTEDISKFSSVLAHLHGQVSKPLLDVVMMTYQLLILAQGSGGGPKALLAPSGVAVVAIYLTVNVLKYFTPPFGRLVARQAELEGELRFAHSRLITNSEEIAFYGGHASELRTLRASYIALVKHMNYIFKKRIFYNMIEGYFLKYVWSAAGMCCIGLPAFFSRQPVEGRTNIYDTVSERTQNTVTARGLLIAGADAVERIMSSYKEVTELAGYTTRVHSMVEVFDDVAEGKYQKKTIQGDEENDDFLNQRGTVKVADYVRFMDVPIITPNGDCLVRSMNVQVDRGMHLLITGPNGCGKSSLFRILGGLWPVYGGTLMKPSKEDLFYIPQRPYLSVGSLREQIIYPHSEAEMKERGYTDADLMEIMDWVHLEYIIDREGGWDSIKSDWEDVLSGGEKQRVGVARVLYHKPKFAILDECTSAVSIDVEGKMYTKAIDLGITLLTVTHRPSLWKYHTHLLQFDGEGGYQFMALNTESRLGLKEEKIQLESQLSGIPRMYKRLKELCGLLGEDSLALRQDSFADLSAMMKQMSQSASQGQS